MNIRFTKDKRTLKNTIKWSEIILLSIKNTNNSLVVLIVYTLMISSIIPNRKIVVGPRKWTSEDHISNNGVVFNRKTK